MFLRLLGIFAMGLILSYSTPVGAVPVVTDLMPTSGPINGTTKVMIAGSNFINGATVSFGGIAATAVMFGNSNFLFAIAPAHTAGVVDVTVTNPDTQIGILSSGYTYVDAAPAVTALEPTSGPIDGTTRVMIAGSNFVNGATVSFGGVAATSVLFGNSTFLFAVAPAHAAGIVDVIVTNPDTSSGTLPNGYTYDAADPAVIAVTPSSGPIGGTTRVMISGTNFVEGATVSFGGIAGTDVLFLDSGFIAVTVPAHGEGAVDVTVTNPDSRSDTLLNAYTYVDAAPAIIDLAPTSGPIDGTTRVIISGSNFVDGARVGFGGIAGTDVLFVNSGFLFVTTPAHAAGAVDVTVTNPDARSDTLPNGYTYDAFAPAVIALTPTSGPIDGTTRVIISGSNFVRGATVGFGGIAGTDVIFLDSGFIGATVPAHAAGAVDVTVTNPDNRSGILPDGYTYDASVPVITGFAPTSGPSGTQITITGTDFTGSTAVRFGGTAARSFTVDSVTRITAVVGPGSTGKVTVTTAGGTAGSASAFTYEAPPATPVPSLSEWGLTILSLLLMGLGYVTIRRRMNASV